MKFGEVHVDKVQRNTETGECKFFTVFFLTSEWKGLTP